MTDFFTSDLHLFHKNILRLCDRPFSSMDEMCEGLIKEWNAKVGEQDHVYVLGDYSFGDADATYHLVTRRLNGHKHLIRGNHDPKRSAPPRGFASARDYHTLRVGDDYVVMSHFPMLSWHRQAHGSWMLHGHCHGNLRLPETLQGSRIFDVGVDNVYKLTGAMEPVTLEQIKAIAGETRVAPLDRGAE